MKIILCIRKIDPTQTLYMYINTYQHFIFVSVRYCSSFCKQSSLLFSFYKYTSSSMWYNSSSVSSVSSFFILLLHPVVHSPPYKYSRHTASKKT